MVTIAVASILLTLAVPSFKVTIERWRVNDARDAFSASFYLARREAIKNGGDVLLIRSTDTTSCTHVTEPKNWGCGWTVCKAAGTGNTCGIANDDELQVVPAPTKINAVDGNNNSFYRFDRWGRPDTASWPIEVLFYPNDTGATSPASSKLCVSGGGRVHAIPATKNCA